MEAATAGARDVRRNVGILLRPFAPRVCVEHRVYRRYTSFRLSYLRSAGAVVFPVRPWPNAIKPNRCPRTRDGIKSVLIRVKVQDSPQYTYSCSASQHYIYAYELLHILHRPSRQTTPDTGQRRSFIAIGTQTSTPSPLHSDTKPVHPPTSLLRLPVGKQCTPLQSSCKSMKRFSEYRAETFTCVVLFGVVV
jgi:hypothetical protein